MKYGLTTPSEKEVAITCNDCGFLLPPFARKTIQREPNLRVDALTCPTCHASFLITVEQTRRTDLPPSQLDSVRNRNRP